MFNLGFGIDEYHPSWLMSGLKTDLKSPVLMHQLLAFASCHLACVHPERFDFYSHQAVALQTKAISLFNAEYPNASVDQSNCVVFVLFASVLGHHTLADALGMRSPRGIHAFISHYVRCVETHRGVHKIATSAWPMLMETRIEPILSLSHAFTSREPKGFQCRPAMAMVEHSRNFNDKEKEACLSALHYLQVGLDAATAEGDEKNRHHMVCTWTMLLTVEFTALLSALRPEALVILAHYAEILHHAKDLWQVRDAGAYVFGLITSHLDQSWDRYLAPIRKAVLGQHNEKPM